MDRPAVAHCLERRCSAGDDEPAPELASAPDRRRKFPSSPARMFRRNSVRSSTAPDSGVERSHEHCTAEHAGRRCARAPGMTGSVRTENPRAAQSEAAHLAGSVSNSRWCARSPAADRPRRPPRPSPSSTRPPARGGACGRVVLSSLDSLPRGCATILEPKWIQGSGFGKASRLGESQRTAPSLRSIPRNPVGSDYASGCDPCDRRRTGTTREATPLCADPAAGMPVTHLAMLAVHAPRPAGYARATS